MMSKTLSLPQEHNVKLCLTLTVEHRSHPVKRSATTPQRVWALEREGYPVAAAGGLPKLTVLKTFDYHVM